MFFGGGGFPFGGFEDGGSFGGPPRRSGPVDNESFYKILEIEKSASGPEIKKAYRKLAIKHHPDKGGDEETFKKLSRAYEVLSDPEKRKRYDQFGEEGLDDSGSGADPSDIFNMFFGGGGRGGGRRATPKGDPIEHKIDVPLEQMYCGKTRKIAINRNIIDQSVGVKTCEECDGKGMVLKVVRMGPMITQTQSNCSSCRGRGSEYKLKKEREVLEVFIEKGARNGQRIVFSNKGDEDPNCETGDVVIILHEKEHPVFHRKGHDLFMIKTISLYEALTGLTMLIEHLDGRKLLVKTKPGEIIAPVNIDMDSKGQHVKAVLGEGMPHPKNPFEKGNLYILTRIEFPESLDPSTHDVLRKILPPSKHLVPDAETNNDYEHHYLEDIDPHTTRNVNHGGHGGHAYDEDEDGGHHHGGAQQVQCAQQ